LQNTSIQLTKAFRSVGLVRGSGTSICADAEYVLVLDHYALGKGDNSTVYSWRAILADDLSAANATIAGLDCILSDTLPATDLEYNRVADAAGARLLARQLRVESGATLSKWGMHIDYTSHDGRTSPISSLEINATGAKVSQVSVASPSHTSNNFTLSTIITI
jgi:hypothetical protein